MIKKILIFFIFFSILNAEDNVCKDSGDIACLTFGERWTDDNRKKNSFSKVCPFLGKEGEQNKEYCVIDDFSFKEGKIYITRLPNIQNTQGVELTANNTRNQIGALNKSINIHELLNPDFADDEYDSEEDKKKEDGSASKLEKIIKNANSGNKEIIPLCIGSIKSLYYNVPCSESEKSASKESCMPIRPFLGFAGINTKSKNNPFMDIFGTNGDELGNLNCGNGPLSNKLDKKLADFSSIGYTIIQWANSEAGSSTNFDVGKLKGKEFFGYDASDESQTWARVMAGVLTLDDAYIEKLNQNGTLNLLEEISVTTDEVTGVIDDEFKWWFIDGKTLFEQNSDGKLWGYYLYMSQNLHKLEILLILSLAGVSFTGLTAWKGFRYFSEVKNEQKEPLQWKKLVMQPVAWTLGVATPLVTSNIAVDQSFILDSSPNALVSEIQVNSMQGSSSSSASTTTGKLFQQTPLQVAIQGGVAMGSALADEFSKLLTYSFAAFLTYREGIEDGGETLVNSLKKEYNGLSADLIELSAYQTLYLSTCVNDYSLDAVTANAMQGSPSSADEEKFKYKKSAHVLPTPFVNLANNDVMSFAVKALPNLGSFGKENGERAVLSFYACQKLEKKLKEQSEVLMPNLLNFSAKFTGIHNRVAEIGISGLDDAQKQKELEKKIKKLAHYEKYYGWINVAMIPLLYQIMYPTFNPYYYAKEVEKTDDNPSADKTEDNYISLSGLYDVIGDVTTLDRDSVTSKEVDELVYKVFSVKDLEDNWFNSIVNYVLSMASYSFMPGYKSVEEEVTKLHRMIDGNATNSTRRNIASRIEVLMAVVADATLNKTGSMFGPNFVKLATHLGLKESITPKPEAEKGGNKAQEIEDLVKKASFGTMNAQQANEFINNLIIKLASQSIYLYILNLMVMVVLAMILMFKIGLFFIQVMIFYMASPLVVIWALITKKEEQVRNYISKSTILIFSPILITLSGTILIFSVGMLHQIYFIIVNHIMNIQLAGTTTSLLSISQYIQLQAFFGIGNIILGFTYLLLGYVILIKFSHWFFETVGIQAQSSITQSFESLTHRMRFAGSFGM